MACGRPDRDISARAKIHDLGVQHGVIVGCVSMGRISPLGAVLNVRPEVAVREAGDWKKIRIDTYGCKRTSCRDWGSHGRVALHREAVSVTSVSCAVPALLITTSFLFRGKQAHSVWRLEVCHAGHSASCAV